MPNSERFQLIIDNRVSAKVTTLEEAVRQAASALSKSEKPKVEIVDLYGAIYSHTNVVALVSGMLCAGRIA